MNGRSMNRSAAFLVLAFLLVAPAWAQEAGQSSTDQKPEPGAKTATISQGTGENDDGQANSKTSSINLETGQALLPNLSPLHWKHLSLLSFSTTYIYDSNFFLQSSSTIPAKGTIVAGLLVYTFKVKHVDLDLQYRPQLELSEAQNRFLYANQLFDAHTFIRLTPRWIVNLSDKFQSTPNNGNLDEAAFVPNLAGGSATRNLLLAGGRGSLTNTFTASTDRKLNGRDRISLLFQHELASLSSLPEDRLAAQAGSPILREQRNLRAEIGWARRLQRGSEAGIRYAYVHEYFPGMQGSTQLHGLLLSYSKRLSASLRLRVEGGPTFVTSPSSATGGPLSANGTSYLAAASLLKTFRRASAIVSYSRSSSFSGRITNSFSDRLEASYSRRFINRLNLTGGAAYETQGQGQTISGKSAWIQSDYRLLRAWSIYSTYGYTTLSSSPQPSVARSLFTSGVRWSFANARR